MSSDYVERRDDGYAVTGSRVSLDSIVHAFVSGESAESIARSFPVLTLEQVYGAITFYLAHRNDIDQYLEERRRELDAAREIARDTNPMFYQNLADAKKQTPLTIHTPHLRHPEQAADFAMDAQFETLSGVRPQ